VLGQPPQERVQRRAVLLDRGAGPAAGDQVRVIARHVGGGEVRGPRERPEPAREAPAGALVGALRLRPRDQRGGERLHELVGGGEQLAAHARRGGRVLVAQGELEDLLDVKLPRDRCWLAHVIPPSCSCAAGGRSSRSARLCDQ